jgi:hypothetical protein
VSAGGINVSKAASDSEGSNAIKKTKERKQCQRTVMRCCLCAR